VAVVGEGPWTNPISGIEETITGVYCSCYDCDNYSFTMDTRFPGSIFMTKLEYKEHQNERRRSYFDRKALKATKDGMARTKEITEAEAVWEGRPVPTFFDIKYGKWEHYEDPVHRFERMFGY
jgi:uncharacterized short protein YbdD (DUF466 family)